MTPRSTGPGRWRRRLVAGLAVTTLPGATWSAPERSNAPLEAAPARDVGLNALKAAIGAARRGDVADARRRQAELGDPVAAKLVDWLLLDATPGRLSPAERAAIAAALHGWPREARRLARLDRPGALVRGGRAAPGLDPSRAYAARRLRMGEALRSGDLRAAYRALVGHGQRPGSVAYAELESFAGWLALRQGDARTAETHFARLAAAVRSPVSKARAAYWRGRAAERIGDPIGARVFYADGARYPTTFYGQLAAAKAGVTELILTPDPIPTRSQRAAFEAADLPRAIRHLAAAGERDLVREFALHQGRQVTRATDLAMLVDMLQDLGETETALLAYRKGAWSGLVLYERGYPLAIPPRVGGGADPALVLAITRQESQFDPRVRSGAGARGMMQILPSTGREVARRLGLAWTDALLRDPASNMRLGSRYLGELSGRFGGSYVLAAAAYNAGPGRPSQWMTVCGDPRSPAADPLDFIECIPFGETRDYVMNVMANYQVYRARLNGGRADLTASSALRGSERPASREGD